MASRSIVPLLDLKKRMKKVSLSMACLSREIDIRYTSLASYMNGYTAMPDYILDQVEHSISEREKFNALLARQQQHADDAEDAVGDTY
jgi:hypothetical protein